MSSQRHSVEAPARDLPAEILAATRAAVLAVGVRRTTLTDVARRAGVSRMTVYRLVPDVETLVLDVMTGEFAAVVDAAERRVARRRAARGRLVGTVTEVVRSLRINPLFARVVEIDPELLLPFVTDRLGSTQRLALLHLRRLVTEGHADGSIRRGDPEAQALTVLLVTTPFVLSPRLLSADQLADVLRELSGLLDRGLAA
jgi:AcrR family transcriptional regulator